MGGDKHLHERGHVVGGDLVLEPGVDGVHERGELAQRVLHAALQVLRVREHPLGDPRRERLSRSRELGEER